MGSSILRLISRKAAVVSSGRGGRRMMTTTTVAASRVSPWLMLPPSEDGGYNFYSLASDKVMSFKKEPPPPPSAEGLMKLVGSSHGWLASFNIDNRHLFLSHPISGRHMKLPDIHTLPQSSFFTRGHRMIVDKIILTSSPAAEECRAMMTFGIGGVALCRPGGGKWTLFGDGCYKDFVYSSRRKRLFCVNDIHGKEAAVECWDFRDPDSPTKDWVFDLRNHDLDGDDHGNPTKSVEEVDHKLQSSSGFYRGVFYLVFAEESDQLFLVTRRVMEKVGRYGKFAVDLFCPDRYIDNSCPYKTLAFDVHEIDYKREVVRYVVPGDGCLNGLAMFVGSNHAFALSAAAADLKPDSIYFTDDQEFTPLEERVLNYGGHDIGIYDYVGRNFSPVYYSCRASDITWILPPPIWFTPTP